MMTGLRFGKGEPLARKRARQAREKARGRDECVDATWRRAQGRCENPRCRLGLVPPKDAASPAQANVGHVHEVVPRSLGGDPTDPDFCVLVCAGCHNRLHYRAKPSLKVVILEPDLGTRGECDWEDGGTLRMIFANER